MNHLRQNFVLLTACVYICCAGACKKAVTTLPPGTDTSQTYFSIKGYIKDQMELLDGQPYSLTHLTELNGKRDSSIVNFYNMDMASVLKTFTATDIGEVWFLGKYKFSNFEEPSTGNRILMYEAKEPELFTRSLTITVDPTNSRILSLYTETARNETLDEQQQRLLYIPLKVIQIQETKSGTFSKTRNLREEYRFLQ